MPIETKKCGTSLSWCQTVIEGAECPSSREGHTLSHFEGSLYLFGGRDVYCTTSELWQYHIEAAVWTKFVLRGTLPPRLEHHTSFIYDRKMFIFGGSLLSDSVLWVFDFNLFEWSKYSFKNGEAPSNRHSHTFVSSNSNVGYLYGGYTTLGVESDELWQYDIDNNVWSPLCPEARAAHTPPPLCGHSSVVYGSTLWIMGGTSSRIIQDALWCYDIELCNWKRCVCTFHPPPLYRHVAIRAGDAMLVYGGTTDDLISYKGLWRFNFDTEEWTQMISKELPALSCHAGVVTYTRGQEHRVSDVPRIELAKSGEQWTETGYIAPHNIHNDNSIENAGDIELRPMTTVSTNSIENAGDIELRPMTTVSTVSKASAGSDEADTLPGMVADTLPAVPADDVSEGYRPQNPSASPPPLIPSVWENTNVCNKFSPQIEVGFTNPMFNNELTHNHNTANNHTTANDSTVCNSSGFNDRTIVSEQNPKYGTEQFDQRRQINQISFISSDNVIDSGEDSGSQCSRSSLRKRRYKQGHSTIFYIAGHGPDCTSQDLVLYKCMTG